MLADLSPLIAATARWLSGSFPAHGGAFAAARCEAQARQAVTVAAWLRYPTALDAGLVAVVGPGGSARLDWVTGGDAADDADGAWRSWVDEVVASWAAELLCEPELARLAVRALGEGEHLAGGAVDFRRLLLPDEDDRRAAALLRHPDLLAPVAQLHAAQLHHRLTSDDTPACT
ncbi:hypothetical protein ABZ646_38225 [Streptomyces sp. NPDC007162]|uniref:hypothetical protein n=1 Tax=Streptomyces sp. NPDC007162 TaxID=3156917 RepID=UPI0033E4BB18